MGVRWVWGGGRKGRVLIGGGHPHPPGAVVRYGSGLVTRGNPHEYRVEREQEHSRNIIVCVFRTLTQICEPNDAKVQIRHNTDCAT
jgi:hypothetical protein